MTIIEIIDQNHDEIETTVIDCNLVDAFNLINQINEIICGTDNLCCEKDNWIAVDFDEKIIRVRVKYE